MPDVRRHVVRIVLEVGRQEPDLGQPLERVEQRRIPFRGRVDDVVVELDDVRRRRQPEGAGIGVLPDVLLAVDDADPRIVERLEDTRLSRPSTRCSRSRSRASRARSGGARSRRTCCSRWTRLCVRTTTAMPPRQAFERLHTL